MKTSGKKRNKSYLFTCNYLQTYSKELVECTKFNTLLIKQTNTLSLCMSMKKTLKVIMLLVVIVIVVMVMVTVVTIAIILVVDHDSYV